MRTRSSPIVAAAIAIALLLPGLAVLTGCRTAELQTVRLVIPETIAEGKLAQLTINQYMYQCDTEVGQGKSLQGEISPSAAASIAAQVSDNVVAQNDATKTGNGGNPTNGSEARTPVTKEPETPEEDPPAADSGGG